MQFYKQKKYIMLIISLILVLGTLAFFSQSIQNYAPFEKASTTQKQALSIMNFKPPTSSTENILYGSLYWSDKDKHTTTKVPLEIAGNFGESVDGKKLSISDNARFAAMVAQRHGLGRELYLISNTGDSLPIIKSDNPSVGYAIVIFVSEWSPSSTRFAYTIRPWPINREPNCMFGDCTPANELVSLPPGFLFGTYTVDIESGEIKWISDSYDYSLYSKMWLSDDIMLLSKLYETPIMEYNFRDATLYPSTRFGKIDDSFRFYGTLRGKPIWGLNNTQGKYSIFIGQGQEIKQIHADAKLPHLIFLPTDYRETIIICQKPGALPGQCAEADEYNPMSGQTIRVKYQ